MRAQGFDKRGNPIYPVINLNTIDLAAPVIDISEEKSK